MNTRTKRLAATAAALLFAWCWSAHAQPARADAPFDASSGASLDLPTAVRLALAQPGLQAAALEVAASEAAAGQAASLPNPELGWLREGRDAGTRTTTVQLSQPVELGGKRRARVALAQGEVALARSELAARRREVRADVIAAWHSVIAGQERQRQAQALKELARRSVEVAARRVAAGKVSPIDATRARLAAVDASGELARADAELAVARTRLGALVGRPAGTLVLAPQDDEALPAVPPLAALLARSGEPGAVGRARSHLAAQQAQAGVERAARIPDLTLTVGSQRDDQAGRRQAVFGVSVPLPLFDRNQGRLTAALRRADKAREELAAARVAADAALAEARTRYDAARNEATLLQDVLPQARSAYELTLTGFEAGKFAFLDVLDAQRTWYQAQSRHAAATLAAWRAWADIERLAGAAEPFTGTTP